MLSPIDLIPEFLPVIGPLDDVIVIALADAHLHGRVATIRAAMGLADNRPMVG